MKAATLEVGAVSGVDLDADGWVNAARRRRSLVEFTSEVEEETARLSRRAQFLLRKARRLRVGSNGRDKAIREAAELQALAMALPAAHSGQKLNKPAPGGSQHRDRAARLLSELLAA